MPCWQHEAQLATLSNTWFLCDDCRELERDIRAAELAAAEILDPPTPAGRTSRGELADSPTKAGSERPETQAIPSQSPPPGARPERDPAQSLELIFKGNPVTSVYRRSADTYATDEDQGDQA